MQTHRILLGRTRLLPLATSLVLAACADAPPTAPDSTVTPHAPGQVLAVAPGQIAEHTIAAGGFASLAVRPNGTVVAWGNEGAGNDPVMDPLGDDVPPGLSGVVSLASFSSHVLALRADGTVVGWGSNRYGQLNIPPLSGVVAVATGSLHSLALRNNGTFVAWGDNTFGQAATFWLTDVVAVEAGQEHSLIIRRGGTVVAWGRNDFGQTSVPPGLRDVVAVAGGKWHSVALRRDGTLVAWGLAAYAQVPAGLSGVIDIAAGLHHTVALKNDGTVVEWNNFGPRPVPAGLTDVVAIDAGQDHTVALRRDGTVVAWGDNGYDQTIVPAGLVARVPGSPPLAGEITRPAGIVAGHRYTFAVGATDAYGGALSYAWDMNSDGWSEQNGALPSIYHGFAFGGMHTVTVTITDARGAQTRRSATFWAEQNVAPQAVIQPIAPVQEGTVVYPRAVVTDANSATEPTELKYVTYRWEFGDGTFSTSATPSKRYNDNGTYTIRLTVTDRGGASSTTETQVQVVNVPPRATFVAPVSTGVVGLDDFVLSARSVTDQALSDRSSLVVAFDCGDGYDEYTRDVSASTSCVASATGSRLSVGLRVRDDDGGITEYRRTYTVR